MCPWAQPTPVMLRMLSATAVGVPVPAVVSACRTRIMASSLCSVFFRHERHTGSRLDTCGGVQALGPAHCSLVAPTSAPWLSAAPCHSPILGRPL